MSFSYLTDSDRERLRRLPFPVALPQELPAGWTCQPLSFFENRDDNECSLEATFGGPGASNWSIVTSNGGVGDVIPGETDHSHQLLQHEVFGQILVHSFTEDEVPEVASDWFPEDEEAGFFHAFRGANISAEDLKVFLDSLDLCGQE